MRLSTLQKMILLQCLDLRGRLQKILLEQWYAQLGKEREMSEHDAQTTVTKSLERLIDNGLLIGHGVRTEHKWFIHEVRLTPQGRRIAKKLRGVQQALPLNN